MADVHDLLRQALGGVSPSPHALEATIRRIRRRERRRRALATAVTLAVVAGAGAGLWATRTAADRGGRLGTPAPTTAPPSTAPPATVPPKPAGFVPPTTREGSRTVLPVTFPDGSTAELVYPTALNLAAMGVQPDVSFLRVRDPGPRFQLVFSRGAPPGRLLGGDRPVGRDRTARGRPVEVWRAVPDPGVLPGTGYWVRYQLGAWAVLAAATDRAMAAEVAGNLDGRQTREGFVVIDAGGPFALSREYGEARGPQLAFGDGDPRPETLQVDPAFRLVELAPTRRSCPGQGPDASREYASRCLGRGGAGSVHAGIQGDREFVRAVFRGLEARNVRLAR
jgi:hypothetical protein